MNFLKDSRSMVIMKDLFISYRVARIVYGYPSVEASLWHLLMKNSWPPHESLMKGRNS